MPELYKRKIIEAYSKAKKVRELNYPENLAWNLCTQKNLWTIKIIKLGHTEVLNERT